MAASWDRESCLAATPVLFCGHPGPEMRPPQSCSAATRSRGLNDRVHAWEVPAARPGAATLDLQHTGCLKRMVATVKRVDAQPGALGQVGAHDLGRKPTAVAALLCAQLEQGDHGPEVTQRVTVATRLQRAARPSRRSSPSTEAPGQGGAAAL